MRYTNGSTFSASIEISREPLVVKVTLSRPAEEPQVLLLSPAEARELGDELKDRATAALGGQRVVITHGHQAFEFSPAAAHELAGRLHAVADQLDREA